VADFDFTAADVDSGTGVADFDFTTACGTGVADFDFGSGGKLLSPNPVPAALIGLILDSTTTALLTTVVSKAAFTVARRSASATAAAAEPAAVAAGFGDFCFASGGKEPAVKPVPDAFCGFKTTSFAASTCSLLVCWAAGLLAMADPLSRAASSASLCFCRFLLSLLLALEVNGGDESFFARDLNLPPKSSFPITESRWEALESIGSALGFLSARGRFSFGGSILT